MYEATKTLAIIEKLAKTKLKYRKLLNVDFIFYVVLEQRFLTFSYCVLQRTGFFRRFSLKS